MSIRTKLLLVLLGCGVAPLLFGCAYFYFAGVRAAAAALRADSEREAGRMARALTEGLRRSDAELLELANSDFVRDFVRGGPAVTASTSATTPGAASQAAKPVTEGARLFAATGGGTSAAAALPRDMRAAAGALLRGPEPRYASLTFLGADRRPLCRVEPAAQGGGFEVRPADLITTASIRADERVWSGESPGVALRAPVTRGPSGAVARITVPVLLGEDSNAARGALVGEVRLDALFAEAGAGEGRNEATPADARLNVAVDASGYVVEHTLDALKYQAVAAAMPSFVGIAEKMSAGESGTATFAGGPSGQQTWVAAYRPVPGAGLAVASAVNRDDAVAGLRRAGLFALALLVPLCVALVALPLVFVGRTLRGVNRVADNMASVAAGNLRHSLEDVHADGEAQPLVENFKLMTERMREQAAREAEARQFESFMRLSSMLTHDLKNAITGLSMLVSNMEQQYHREEFREDAIYSLREATDKLRRIVARLSEPVKSLSGEYRSDARRTDLVPIIRRVVAERVAPAGSLYESDERLPEQLFAHVEPTRVENVIENLVANAIEAMGGRGGRLTIEAGEESPGYVFLSVADTGPGMSEEFVKTKLFRPFATTKAHGIGLGLYTCREVVEAHGGRLDVVSKQGSGTRFRVVLPSEPFRLRERMQQSSQQPAPATPARDESRGR